MLLVRSLVCFFAAWCAAAADIDPRTHDIFVVTEKTFDKVVSKFRGDGVAAVLFYSKTKGDGSDALIDGAYNEVATTLKGQIKIAACNCDEWENFCAAQGVTVTPAVIVFPPNPRPQFQYEGPLGDKKGLISALTKLIPAKRTRILDHEKLPAFLAESVAVPKVILYSDKSAPSPLFNSLANSFSDRMSFGFVQSTNEKAIAKMKVSKFPTITIQKGSGGKPEVYDGRLTFKDLHEWLNIRSETFVKGGGFAEESAIEELKPWLSAKFPEMFRASHQDICFKHKAICIILLTAGEVTDVELDVLERLSDMFDVTSGSRGPKFRWSWMNMAIETHWKELFAPEALPSIAAFHSGKRPRFMSLQGDLNATFVTAKDFIDRILGGDARFQNIKKNPQFVDRPAKPPARPDRTEL